MPATRDKRGASFGTELRRGEDREVAQLVREAQNGCDGAFKDLYVRFQGVVRLYFQRVLGERYAEEATQEVFVRVLKALPDYEFRGPPFESWLFRIARNCSLDLSARYKRATVEEPEVVGRQVERRTDPAPTTIEGWISDSQLALLVNELPMTQQRVLTLRFAGDMDATAIGEVLDMSADAVRHSQHRAVRALEARLGSAF